MKPGRNLQRGCSRHSLGGEKNVKTGTSRILRALSGVLVLATTLYLVDIVAVVEQVSSLSIGWMVVGVLLCHGAYWATAWRWWYLADRVGAPMTYCDALSDYLWGGLLNQVLPTGLAGSSYRSVRHAKRYGPSGEPIGMGKAVSVVVLDRVSGMVAQAVVALVGALALLLTFPWVSLWGAIAVLLSLFLMTFALRAAGRRFPEFDIALSLAIRGQGALVSNALISLLGVLLLSLAFYCAAESMALHLPLWRVLCVSPLILGAMIIPLSIAGWGVREAAAGALLAALGTDAATGVAVSVSFGLMSLISTSPALLFWRFFSSKGTEVADHPSGEK